MPVITSGTTAHRSRCLSLNRGAFSAKAPLPHGSKAPIRTAEIWTKKDDGDMRKKNLDICRHRDDGAFLLKAGEWW